MSKGSLFWGKGSGKLGETVLYRAGGEQRARTYVSKIKNPKTLAQMENRLSMRNFAQVFRSLKPILEKSFPNRPAKESGFNAFVKANKNIRSAVLSQYGAQQGLCVPYDMLLSQGYLTQFGEFGKQSYMGDTIPAFNLVAHPNIDAIRAITPASDSLNGYPSSGADWQALWDALQIPINGKITIVVGEYADEGYTVKYTTLSRDSSWDVINALDYRPVLVRSATGNTWVPLLGTQEESAEALVAFIVSYPDANGKLQVTNSRCVVPSDDTEYAEQFVKGGDVYQQVLNAYGYNDNSII